MHVYICKYVYLYMYIIINVFMCMCTYTTDICTYAYIYIYMYVYTHVCAYTHVYTHTCIHTRVYIYIFKYIGRAIVTLRIFASSHLRMFNTIWAYLCVCVCMCLYVQEAGLLSSLAFSMQYLRLQVPLCLSLLVYLYVWEAALSRKTFKIAIQFNACVSVCVCLSVHM